jgi:phenylacetic acid degradation operon negative regulatory protein
MRPVEPSPKSLILDLLSTVGRSSAPVRALICAAELFGIGENRLRVALARLGAEGLVESDGRGRYRLGRRARAVSDEIRGWRRLDRRLRPWQGAWIGVQTARLGNPGGAVTRCNRARALRLLGFRSFGPGLEIRPDNLCGGVADVRQRLAALGLAESGLVLRLDELDPEADADARALWDGQACVASYRTTRAALEHSGRQLALLTRPAAMIEAFRVGGTALRQLVLDPLLPEPIVPACERRALIESMQRYDSLGREAWSGWLGEAEPAGTGVPLGVREPSPAEASGLALAEGS